MTRWAVNFAIAALIVLIAGVLRIGRQRATVSAVEAEHSLQRVEALQELSAELAGAVSSDEISHALAERAAALLGADGAALGVLESEDVLVVDPIGLATAFHVPGRRISLDRSTLLTAAVREARIVRADDREALDREFPDSAAILPAVVQSALAVPLRVAGKPLGVVEFLFDRPECHRRRARSSRSDERRARRAGARTSAPLRAGARDADGARPHPPRRAALLSPTRRRR